MEDFADDLRGWDMYDGSKDDEYERLKKAFDQNKEDANRFITELQARLNSAYTINSRALETIYELQDEIRYLKGGIIQILNTPDGSYLSSVSREKLEKLLQ